MIKALEEIARQHADKGDYSSLGQWGSEGIYYAIYERQEDGCWECIDDGVSFAEMSERYAQTLYQEHYVSTPNAKERRERMTIEVCGGDTAPAKIAVVRK